MSMTDPIADMLTRIRNACRAGHKKVDIPASRLKREIARILMEQKFIHHSLIIDDHRGGVLRLYLRYDQHNESVIRGILRVSKAGLRYYVGRDKMPRVLNGLGVAILTTSRGVLTDQECRRLKVGGEVICHVW
ncbi:MAG: 30S ribosomal protein S8 [Candidatus Latescibacteria bacterium]|nr:30S ribosomal protein S8 [Candidatus Latescibacterota bacterium]